MNTTEMTTHTLEVPGATLTYDIRRGDGTDEPILFLVGLRFQVCRDVIGPFDEVRNGGYGLGDVGSKPQDLDHLALVLDAKTFQAARFDQLYQPFNIVQLESELRQGASSSGITHKRRRAKTALLRCQEYSTPPEACQRIAVRPSVP